MTVRTIKREEKESQEKKKASPPSEGGRGRGGLYGVVLALRWWFVVDVCV